MPVAPPPPQDEPAAAAAAGDILPSVLLVDDSPEKLLALESALRGLPITIVKANSGREALRRLLAEDFALILLDVRMPLMDGFETAALIRQRFRSAHTPIIFVTAVGDDVHVARGYSLHAVDYLLTPVVADVLRTKVRVFVDLWRMNAQVRRQAASLAHRTRQLHRLSAASLAINATLSVDKMLTTVAESALDIFGAHRAVVRAQIDDGTHHAVASVPGALADLNAEATVASIVAGTRRAYRDPIDEPPGRPRLRTLAAPLTGRDGRHLGVIQVSGKSPERFTEQDEDVLVQLAQMASIAIENTIFSEAREANRLKDEFVATVSHELRTPLNAILSWVWMLRRGSLDAAATNRAIEAIERSVKAQTRIVDDLLDISRIATGKLKLELQPVELAPLIESAIEATTAAGEAKEIRIVPALDPAAGPVLGDPSRLQQVIWNLLSNAIKFTSRGGRVDVQLLRVGAEVVVRVTDTGRGIPTTFLPHVFEPFRQADGGAARRTGGLGLGLAIVRQLVERHGGRVEAESDGEGRGATFTVILPAASLTVPALPLPAPALEGPPARNGDHAGADATPAPASDAANGRHDEITLAGLRVLIVEDDSATLEALVLIVSQAGADVRTASTARDALGVVASWGPQVILCDIGLPGEDGYALMRAIRGLPAASGGATPAVACTAYAQAADRTRALDAGFLAHLPKPIDPPELIRVLSELPQLAREAVAGPAHGAVLPANGA